MSTNEEIIAEIRAGGDRQNLMLALWEQNEGLIFATVKKYEGYAEHDDLMQEAYIGLDKAVKHYDTAAGAKFTTLLPIWIKQVLQRYITDKSTVVRLPSYLHAKMNSFKSDIKELTSKLKREPTLSEICEYTGYSPEDTEKLRMYAYTADIKSLDAPIKDEEGLTLGETIAEPTDDYENLENRIYREQLKADLWGAVAELPEIQGDILRLRYIGGLTVEQAGKASGMTKEVARSQENKAMRKLREPKTMRRLRPYLEDIRGNAMKGAGVKRFNVTWTSATEREALKLW